MKPASLAVLLAGALGLAAATPAHAISISIFNSGVAADGSVLADGAADPHWTVAQGTGAATAATAVDSNKYPLIAGPWVANASNARWVGPAADQSAGTAAGVYHYRTTFDLTGLDPSTVQLSGQWTADNGSAILLNGASTGLTTLGDGFTQLFPLSITSGFQPGINTLEVFVANSTTGSPANPTGMQIILTGTGSPAAPSPVPEAASFGLLSLGLAGLALRYRARR